QLAVGDVATVEDPAGGQLLPTGRQVVEQYRREAVVQTGRRHRAADVSRAPRDQDLHGSDRAGRRRGSRARARHARSGNATTVTASATCTAMKTNASARVG